MGLHYVTFTRRNLENRMKLKVVRIRNVADTKNMKIANTTGIISDSVAMNNIFNA